MARNVRNADARPGPGSRAPYCRDGLGDIERHASYWNQGLGCVSGRLSDTFVQFYRPIWVVYL